MLPCMSLGEHRPMQDQARVTPGESRADLALIPSNTVLNNITFFESKKRTLPRGKDGETHSGEQCPASCLPVTPLATEPSRPACPLPAESDCSAASEPLREGSHSCVCAGQVSVTIHISTSPRSTPSPPGTDIRLDLVSKNVSQLLDSLRAVIEQHEQSKVVRVENEKPQRARRESEAEEMGGEAAEASERHEASSGPKQESLDEYLERNLAEADLSGSNNQLARFQSGFPWRNLLSGSAREAHLCGLTEQEVKLFESLFEILVSEKSYLKNLNALCELAGSKGGLEECFSHYDWKTLFRGTELIQESNSRLYAEWALGFERDVFMTSLLHTLARFLEEGHFEPYVDYMRAQPERSRLIQDPAGGRAASVAHLASLGKLFITPLQRITRYPILVENVLLQLSQLVASEAAGGVSLSPQVHWRDLHSSATRCLELARQFAAKCDQALENQKNLYELIEFRKRLTGEIADLVSPKRKIYEQVPVRLHKRINWNEQGNSSAELKAKNLSMVLLTDLLILVDARPRRDDLLLLDYDKLDQVEFRLCGEPSLWEVQPSSPQGATPTGSHATPSPDWSKCHYCLIQFGRSENVYRLSFSNSDDEQRVFSLFKLLKSGQHNKPDSQVDQTCAGQVSNSQTDHQEP